MKLRFCWEEVEIFKEGGVTKKKGGEKKSEDHDPQISYGSPLTPDRFE